MACQVEELEEHGRADRSAAVYLLAERFKLGTRHAEMVSRLGAL
jgi:hypothetical protein